MTRYLRLPLVLVLPLVLGACASKAGYHSGDTSTVRLDVENEQDNNPILLEEEYEAEQKGEVTQWDIPVTRNAKVEQWMSYFQGRGRKWFHLWLERSGRYIPMMRKILKDHDLPEDLVYLAMIESGFSVRAYSRARAVGPWQFMKATGRLYGLQADFWRDERRDPEKSTIAAARHLKDLYDQFQSWKLAAAAYNAGPRKVERAIKRYRTEDFWELVKGRYLRAETRHYVPKLIAAALIAKEPEKYGFKEIGYQEPLAYDKVIVREPVHLEILADKVGVERDELLALNPELNHAVTPPGEGEYELRVPRNSSQKFMVALDNLGADEKFNFTAHQIRKGDTLASISRRYRVPVEEILRFNRSVSNRRLRLGQQLLIAAPGAGAKPYEVAIADRDTAEIHANRGTDVRVKVIPSPAPVTDSEDPKPSSLKRREIVQSSSTVHVVRSGESLWSIAQRYNITVAEIKNENNLRRNRIWPGKRLVIPRI